MLEAQAGRSRQQAQPGCCPQPGTHALLCVHPVLRGLPLTDLCRDRASRARNLGSLAPRTTRGHRMDLYTIDVCEGHGGPVPGPGKNWVPGTAGLRDPDPLASLYLGCRVRLLF